jgi:NADPH2:quinone reductase
VAQWRVAPSKASKTSKAWKRGKPVRAWRIVRHGEPLQALECADIAAPEPAEGQLRIRVEAAALGLPDVFMCRGSYAFRPELPFTPGQEVAGVVEAAGAGCTTPVGARVMAVTAFFTGWGGFADSALALDMSTHPAPADMDAAAAASFVIPYHTAFIGLRTRGRIAAGETLLVLGAAGGSGSAAVVLGKVFGARVIAVAGGDDKAAACREFGADRVIDHRTQDFAAEVRDATDGRGADVVFDPVGGAAFDAALHCIASEGRLLAVGYASGRWSDASTRALVGNNAAVVGVFVGAYDRTFLAACHAELLDLWRRRQLRSLVSSECSFEDLPEALDALAQRRTIGKTVMRPGG